MGYDMNIYAINAYNNQKFNEIQENMKISNIKIEDKSKTDKTFDQQTQTLKNQEKIITETEREFFMNLFPENSQQIENHILFNRNGRIMMPSISKGSILDGKA